MNIKKITASILISGVLLTGIAAYADTANNTSVQNSQNYTSSISPRYGRTQMVDVFANLLGKTKEETLNLLNSNKTLAQIATENGVNLEDFKSAMLKVRTEYIDQMVRDGKITEERATEIKNLIQERINACDGTGNGGAGLGIGYSRMTKGNGYGREHGTGVGKNLQ